MYGFLSVDNTILVDISSGFEVIHTLKFENNVKNTFYVITSPNDVITSKMLHLWKVLIKPFDMRYYTIWFVENKNLTFGRSTSTLGGLKGR